MTKIEWTDVSWNPIVGCSVVSPGCTNCYAMRMAGTRLKSTDAYRGLTQDTKAGPVWNGKVRFLEERLTQPLKWRKPRRVFVNSMGDLFHEDMTDDQIGAVFEIMRDTPRHTYQVLTKRPERMRAYLEGCERGKGFATWLAPWPLPNVWLGTSIEDQKRSGRAWDLANTPAAVRFWSIEPLLEGLGDLTPFGLFDTIDGERKAVDWVIVGGESGPKARDMDPDWARDIRDQCKAAGVAFFMKQMARKAAIPDDLKVREFPP